MFNASDKLKEGNRAIGAYIRRNIVAVLQEFEGKEYMGSGVCVQISDRLFIATAAHNFQDVPSGGTFKLLSPNILPPTPLQVKDRNYSSYGQEGTLDTAWLEVDEQQARKENLTGITLDTIEPYHVMDKENATYASVGFAPHFLVLATNPNSNSDPIVIQYTKPAKDADPNDDELLLHLAEQAVKDGVNVPMPFPGGISGGGIWSVPHLDKTEIWSPEKYRLIGINTSVTVDVDQIIGLRMYHWLRLLHSDHPELHQYLDPLLNRNP